MKYFQDDLSSIHLKLQQIIRQESQLERSRLLFLELHARLHESVISATKTNEVDNLLEDLQPYEFAIMPTSKDETIAWTLWHIARIEDLTMNVLAAKSQPVFDKQWQKRLKIDIMDTGNAMNDDEIMAFSHQINTSELLAYRRAVAISTRNFIKKLSYEDLIRKVAVSDLEQIKQSGGVTGQPESNWLLDFWHKKDIAGLLLMPPTRHVMLHLNACSKWKLAIRTKKKFYRS